jgi:hypothetical protein
MKTISTKPLESRWVLPARLVVLAGLLAAISAAAGLFMPDLYRDSVGWVRQARAADSVTLLAVLPILAWSLWRAARGSASARIVALAAVGYLIYNYAIFAFSVAINPMTPLHIAVLGLSVWSTILSLGVLAEDIAVRNVGPRLPRRTSAAYLLSVAGLFGFLWASQIAQAIVAGHAPEDVTRLGLVTNPVYTLDLALALPFLAFTGVLLLRRDRKASAMGLAALSWSVLMGLGVLAIFAFDAVAGAVVSVPMVAFIALITLAAVGLLGLGQRAPRTEAARLLLGAA